MRRADTYEILWSFKTFPSKNTFDAYTRTLKIEVLELKLTILLQSDPQFSRNPQVALAALKFLFANPVTTISHVSQDINKAYNMTQKIITKFIELGIISEKIAPVDQKNKRSKYYQFDMYLTLLQEEY